MFAHPLTHACAASTAGRHGYLRSLPAREYLPVFWSVSEVSELQGTELQDKPAQDRCARGGISWDLAAAVTLASGAFIRMQAGRRAHTRAAWSLNSIR